MLYDSQIKKVLKIVETENKNTIDSNILPKIDKTLVPENFNKQLVVIHLIKGYDISDRVGGTFSPLVTFLVNGPISM